MPLEKKDVLDVLSDNRLSQIDFWVENLHVKPAIWAQVRDFIDNEDITLIKGTYPNNAFYNDNDDTLTTPDVNPPTSLDTRGLILHECVHAYVDMLNLDITALSEEIAGYLVQHTFLLVANPGLGLRVTNTPWLKFFQDLFDFVNNYKLNQPAGRGTRLSLYSILFLRAELNTLPSANDYYRSLKADQRSGSNGVQRKIHMRQVERVPVNISIPGPPHPPSYSIPDGLLVEILEKRYAANDVAGFGGRVKRLEQIFQGAYPPEARKLVPRLASRKSGDKVSVYFHDHLSTAARTSLLGILQSRAAQYAGG